MCVLRIYDSGRSSLHELLCSCRLNVLRRRSLLARKLAAELHNILADLQITAHLKMLDFIHVSPPWLDCFPCTVYLAILKILTLRQFWFCVFFFLLHFLRNSVSSLKLKDHVKACWSGSCFHFCEVVSHTIFQFRTLCCSEFLCIYLISVQSECVTLPLSALVK